MDARVRLEFGGGRASQGIAEVSHMTLHFEHQDFNRTDIVAGCGRSVQHACVT